MKKIALYGSGHLIKIIVDCYKKNILKGYEIIGCYSKTLEHCNEINNELGLKPLSSFDEVIARHPDYLVEATNPSATKLILEKTIKAHINVVLLSIGALAEPSYLEKIEKLASENSVKIHLASG